MVKYDYTAYGEIVEVYDNTNYELSKIKVGKNVIVKEIMNSDALGVFNTVFSGWLDFAIGVIF